MPKKKSNNKPKNKKRQFKIVINQNGRGPNKFWVNMLTALLVLVLILMGYSLIVGNSKNIPNIPVSEMAQNVKDGSVKSIAVIGDSLDVIYNDKSEKTSQKESGAVLSQILINYGVTHDQLSKVAITVKNDQGFWYWVINLSPIIVPVLLILFFLWFLTRQVKGAGMQAFTFGQSKARMTLPDDKKQRVTFKDVAGSKEAKNELEEVVDFLKNPKKFISIGAKIPKGILLMGAPGTGKTLLARAVAGEAGVAFFSISGSEFVEMFVGVGASRVRDLFKVAKTAAPAIIFVDEIDAVGRVRGSGVGGGNDEREQTLNQILVEMDGFEPNEKVIVMAATNRPDVLDPALLRPGRFDRRVIIDLPDRNDREQILKSHSRRTPLAPDVKFDVIAARTPGFSGADLANLVNEAAIVAARDDRKEISQYDLIQSIEKVMLGPERTSHVLSEKEKELTAYHEAGHALVASILPFADPVHKVSVISRGRAAGYTLKLPFEDKKMQSRQEFLDDIAVSLAGYVTEKMLYGDVTTGPSNDLQVSTALARDMVTKYGMSDEIGTVALEGSGGRVLFGRGVDDKEYSPEVAAKIDSEVSKIMKDNYKRAEDVIAKHRKALDAIATELVDRETLERKEFEDILIVNGITPKKKDESIEKK